MIQVYKLLNTDHPQTIFIKEGPSIWSRKSISPKPFLKTKKKKRKKNSILIVFETKNQNPKRS
jgi:hypothetical protein